MDRNTQCVAGLTKSTILKYLLIFYCVWGVLQPAGQYAEAAGNAWSPLVARLTADGFNEQQLVKLFSRPDVTYDPGVMAHKINALYTKKFGSQLVRNIQRELHRLGYYTYKVDGFIGSKTRQAIRGFQQVQGLKRDGKASKALLHVLRTKGKKRPAGYALPSIPKRPNVYASITTPERLREAKAFYLKHQPELLKMERTYGVPASIATGLLAVETRFGTYLGEEKAFLSLASMARTTSFASIRKYFKGERLGKKELRYLRKRTQQKSDWAYKELKALLRHAWDLRRDPLAIPGSVYGAIGICQFMPSNVSKFGKDGNGDGLVDLFDLEDALHSLGNYLKKSGWHGNSRKQQRRALYHYNHSKVYVNTILYVADYVRK